MGMLLQGTSFLSTLGRRILDSYPFSPPNIPSTILFPVIQYKGLQSLFLHPTYEAQLEPQEPGTVSRSWMELCIHTMSL